MTKEAYEHFDPSTLSAREVDEFFSLADDEDIEAVLAEFKLGEDVR